MPPADATNNTPWVSIDAVDEGAAIPNRIIRLHRPTTLRLDLSEGIRSHESNSPGFLLFWEKACQFEKLTWRWLLVSTIVDACDAMGTTMDVAEFGCWLSGIAALTTPQRRQAWQTLALSEASDCDDTETGPHWGGDIDDSGSAAMPDQPPTFTPAPVARPLNRLGRDVVVGLGQRRGDRLGCPHCDSRDVVHWGKASALPRYRCKDCQLTLNALTKTPLAGLRMKDKWPAP